MAVISVINQKGGVAKTTTSINVAHAWASMGKKVLLLDLDPQSSATKAIFGQQEFENTIYDVLINRVPVESVIVRSDTFDFDVIPSEIMLSGVDIQLAAYFGRERILRKKMENIKRKYDAILIDCSPSLGLLTVNALMTSNEIIIPICPEYFSLKGIDLILDTIENLKKGLNYPISIRGIIITRYKNRKIVRQVIDEIKSSYDIPVLSNYIPDNIAVEESHHQHLPLLKYSPRSKASVAYKSLSEELWK